jgi:hypothetical protein
VALVSGYRFVFGYRDDCGLLPLGHGHILGLFFKRKQLADLKVLSKPVTAP